MTPAPLFIGQRRRHPSGPVVTITRISTLVAFDASGWLGTAEARSVQTWPVVK